MMHKIYEARITTEDQSYIHAMYEKYHKNFCNELKIKFIERVNQERLNQASQSSVLKSDIQIFPSSKISQIKQVEVISENISEVKIQQTHPAQYREEKSESLMMDFGEQISSIEKPSGTAQNQQIHFNTTLKDEQFHDRNNKQSQNSQIRNFQINLPHPIDTNPNKFLNYFLAEFQQLPQCETCKQLKERNQKAEVRIKQLQTINETLLQEHQQFKQKAQKQSLEYKKLNHHLQNKIKQLEQQIAKQQFFPILSHKHQKQKISASEILTHRPFDQKNEKNSGYDSDAESLPNSSDREDQQTHLQIDSSWSMTGERDGKQQ